MLDYIFLGIIQGIFEWIPISSEGVVALFSRFLLKDLNPVDVALFLHLGTLFAVLIYFRRDWQEILLFKNIRLLKFLTITTIVSVAIGYPLYKTIKDVTVGNGLLMVIGLGLFLTAYFHKKRRTFQIKTESLALSAGFLQGLAVIPGVSRSGATIFGLSLGKTKPEEILKVSYLMSAPIVLLSSVYLWLEEPVLIFEAWPALISSFVVGFLTLNFLLRFASRINFFGFSLIFGLICLLGGIIGFVV